MEKQERKEKKEAFGSEVPIDSDSQSSNDNSLRASQVAVISSQNVEMSTKVNIENTIFGSTGSVMNEVNNAVCKEREIEMAETEMTEDEEEENGRKYPRLDTSPHTTQICADASFPNSFSNSSTSPNIFSSSNDTISRASSASAPVSGCLKSSESELKLNSSSHTKFMVGPISNVIQQARDVISNEITVDSDKGHSEREREESRNSKSSVAAPSSSSLSFSHSFLTLPISSDRISTSSLDASPPELTIPTCTATIAAIKRNRWLPDNLLNVDDTSLELSPSDFSSEVGSIGFIREPEPEPEPELEPEPESVGACQMKLNAMNVEMCTLDDESNVGLAKRVHSDVMISDRPKDIVQSGPINGRGNDNALISLGSRLKTPISNSDGKGREKLKSNSNNYNNCTSANNHNNVHHRKSSSNNNNSNNNHYYGVDKRNHYSKHPVDSGNQSNSNGASSHHARNNINNDSNDNGSSDGKSNTDSNNNNNSRINNSNHNNNNDNRNSSNQKNKRYDNHSGNNCTLVNVFKKSKINVPTPENFGRSSPQK